MLFSFFFFLLALSFSCSADTKFYEVDSHSDAFPADERGGVGTSCYLTNTNYRQCFGVAEMGSRRGELACNFEVSNGRSCAHESRSGQTCQSTCSFGECLPCRSSSEGEGEGTPSPVGNDPCPSCVSPCDGVSCDCGATTCNPTNGTVCEPCGAMGQLACSPCTTFLCFFCSFFVFCLLLLIEFHFSFE